ncbi:MAG: hypothetical protein BZ136_09120 [Methanosphaera sp. rholeuAM74]|nr:MAG: hypothetical protein BZ136_09120 [Methanosphaera sp. rholeuAM74]
MNKKFLAILLIIGLLTVGLSTTFADGSTDGSNIPLAVADAPSQADTTTGDDVAGDAGDNVTDENLTVTAGDENATNETNDTSDDNKTNTSRFDDAYYEELAKNMDNLDDSTYDALISSLMKLNDSQYENLLNALQYPNMYDATYFENALKDLDNFHLLVLLGILDDLDNSSNHSYVSPANSNVAKNNVAKNNSISNVIGDTLKSVGDSFNKVFKPAQSNNYNNHVPDGLTDYQVYKLLLQDYLDGKVSFEQLKSNLEFFGIDTSTMILNDDGSIQFFGETSPVPVTTPDGVDNNTATDNNDVTNTTDTNDTTNSGDTGNDAETSDSTNTSGSTDSTDSGSSGDASTSDAVSGE